MLYNRRIVFLMAQIIFTFAGIISVKAQQELPASEYKFNLDFTRISGGNDQLFDKDISTGMCENTTVIIGFEEPVNVTNLRLYFGHGRESRGYAHYDIYGTNNLNGSWVYLAYGEHGPEKGDVPGAVEWHENEVNVSFKYFKVVTQSHHYGAPILNEWEIYGPPALSEVSSTDFSLAESLNGQKAILKDIVVSGDLAGTFDFTNFEIVKVLTGAFAGKGFFRGQWEATLEGIHYLGDWGGVIFHKPLEGKIYLKGSTSGDIVATVEGYLTESTVGNGIYDQYQVNWRIGRLGTTVTSATINLNGTLSYQNYLEFPDTELYVLQTSMEGIVSGHYSNPISIVLTQLRVTDESNPYYGQGFSIISYVSDIGSGEGWTYDKKIRQNVIELKGIFTNPLLGIVYARLDERSRPRKLSVAIERIDLGLPPQPDLKVRVWGPQRVSPGQKIDYIIEYKNDGLKAAGNVFISCYLDTLVKYISASPGVYYSPYAHRLSWKIGNLPAKTTGYLTFKVEVVWGLPEGFPLEQNAFITNIGE